MTEHFPKSTETATAWCRPCSRMTEHRIDGGRVGPCLDPKHPLRSKRLDEIMPDYEGVCPCGRKFYIDSARYAVIHEMPTCQEFDKREPDEYLRYVRQTLTGIVDN